MPLFKFWLSPPIRFCYTLVEALIFECYNKKLEDEKTRSLFIAFHSKASTGKGKENKAKEPSRVFATRCNRLSMGVCLKVWKRRLVRERRFQKMSTSESPFLAWMPLIRHDVQFHFHNFFTICSHFFTNFYMMFKYTDANQCTCNLQKIYNLFFHYSSFVNDVYRSIVS